MSYPYDLEDVAGVAVIDTLRRVVFLAGVFVGGAWMGSAAVLVGEMVAWGVETGTWDLSFLDMSLWRTLLLPLRPIFSLWGVLYVPLLVAAGFYFAKAAAPGLRAWVTFYTLIAFFGVVGRGEPGWFKPSVYGIFIGPTAVSDPGKLYAMMMAVGLVVWAGMSGALWFLALFRERRKRMEAEVHFAGLAVLNRLEREEMERESGLPMVDRPRD